MLLFIYTYILFIYQSSVYPNIQLITDVSAEADEPIKFTYIIPGA